MCVGGATASDQLESLAESLLQSCLALAASLHCLTAGGAGPSLKEALSAAAGGVLGPAGQLVKDMAAVPSDAAAVKASVGHLWGALDACVKVSSGAWERDCDDLLKSSRLIP